MLRLGLTFITACSFFFVLTLQSALTGALAAGPETHTPSGLPVPRFVALKNNKTYGRVGPSFDYPVRYEFHRKHLPLRVIAETPDNVWRKVEDFEGKTMWIHRSQLVNADMVMIIGSDAVALRADGRDNAAIRAMTEPGVLAKIEQCDQNWCRVTIDRFRGWLPVTSLWGVNP